MKKLNIKHRAKQAGVVTLLISSAVLVSATLMTLFASNSTKNEHQLTTNNYSTKQAFEAAEAGLEYGYMYLNANKSTILPANYQGNVNSNAATLTNSQPNGSGYTVTFSNPVAGDSTLIKVTVSGKDNNNQNKQVSQLVKYVPAVNTAKIPKVPLTSRDTTTLTGNSDVSNPVDVHSVWCGKGVKVSGSANVKNVDDHSEGCSAHSSTNTSPSDKIVQNDAGLFNQTENGFFQNYFGLPKSNVKNNCQNFYKVTGQPTDILGAQNQFIWYNGNLSINSNTNIGSPTKPVILVVDGNFTFNGNAKFYGFLVVNGNFNSANGNAEVNGATTVRGTSNLSGSIAVNYDPDILTKLNNNVGNFVKVPGSWMDN